MPKRQRNRPTDGPHCHLCKEQPFVTAADVRVHKRLFHGVLETVGPKGGVTFSRLPRMELITRRAAKVSGYGQCERCGSWQHTRWRYAQTTRGQATLCDPCRDRYALGSADVL